MKQTSWKSFAVLAGLAAVLSAKAAPSAISIDVDKPLHEISPALWGVFFEDINLSADGGIYPELVRNRSFEDASTPQDWRLVEPQDQEKVWSIDGSKPLNAFNRRSLRIESGGVCAIENDGYWGMNFASGEHYQFKVAARAENNFNGSLEIMLCNAAGGKLASGQISELGGNWKYYTLDLTPSESDAKGRLQIRVAGKGVVFLDMVSLLPIKTWKNHGLRADLAESLAALHPSFLRFPGGCWVEGEDFAHMNRWKNTVGNIDTRTPLWNIWGYNATHGLGFHEYLQLCEDLGAAPLFCINVGMSHKENAPLDRMSEWVQDALDALEYANGPTNSVWGAQRANAGHPGSFHLNLMEIGNENGGAAYAERWPLFVHAIRQKYPEVKFVANHWDGGYPRQPMPDIVDEHYYETPETFMRMADHYDNYDRKGPKIFVGEYAVTKKCGLGNLRGAIGEAAFMTGLERNSDIVVMASYAPLLVNLNHRAWNPDLINFDSSRWYGLPSYYVQKIFSENRGDVALPAKVECPMAEIPPIKGKIGVGTWNTAAEFKDIQVTAPDGRILFVSDFSRNSEGWALLGQGADWKVKDGVLRQDAERRFIHALAGDQAWTDYNYTLKARKISGAEGFLILFHSSEKDGCRWWNIGGWGNTRDCVESDRQMDFKPSHVETNRWYDIRLEIRGQRVKCVLDGQVVHDVDLQQNSPVKALYASATRDKASGDVIVKVVNADAKPLETELNLRGANLAGPGAAIVLTSENGEDENSLDEPTKVSPKSEQIAVRHDTFTRIFPGNSFTVLRLKTKLGKGDAPRSAR